MVHSYHLGTALHWQLFFFFKCQELPFPQLLHMLLYQEHLQGPELELEGCWGGAQFIRDQAQPPLQRLSNPNPAANTWISHSPSLLMCNKIQQDIFCALEHWNTLSISNRHSLSWGGNRGFFFLKRDGYSFLLHNSYLLSK